MNQFKKSNEFHLQASHVSQRPYSERQIIVVVADKVVEAERKAREAEISAKTNKKASESWSQIALQTLSMFSAFGTVSVASPFFLAEVTISAIKALGYLRDSGINALFVGQSEASTLKFSPGHPREGILYVGHPAQPSVYYTTAQFHRLTFEHKFSEAVELLMALGANKISVEHQSGWSNDFAANLAAPLTPHGGQAKASAKASSRCGSQLLFKASLTPKKTPGLPSNLVWYDHEPTWQQIAKGRLDHGLKNFCLILRYEDDFGVNAGLKLTASKAGLDLGGKFENHQSTVWKIEGTFADLP